MTPRLIKTPVHFADEYERYYTSPVKARVALATSSTSSTSSTTRKRVKVIASTSSRDESESESESESSGSDDDFSSTPELATSPKKRTRRTTTTTTRTARSTKASTSTTTRRTRTVTSRASSRKSNEDGGGKENGKGIFHFDAALLPNSPKANLEICFSFDTTGSMSGYINTVKEKLETLAKQLITDLPNIRISILAHGDYCDAHNYILRRIDFSNDHVKLSDFIKETTMTGGGDADEAYELVLRDVQSLSWSDSSNKALVVIGDAAPHRPNQYRKIDWKEELDILKNMGIKVYGVRCGCQIDFYKTIAEVTDGATLDLEKFQEISEMMAGLAYREAMNMEAQENERNMNNKDEEFVGRLVRMPSKNGAGAAGAITADSDDNKGKDKASEENEEYSGLDPAESFRVHESIHRGDKSINIKGVEYDIAIGRAGCKFVRIGEQTFIEQNKDKNTKYSRMAAEGRKITWIIQRGNWGLIMGEKKVELNEDEAKAESGHS